MTKESATTPPGDVSQYFGKDLEAMTAAKNYREWLLAEFGPYLGTSVAEVGAGAGSLSTMLLDADIDRLVAFEPSLNMYPKLLEAVGGDARARTVNGVLESEAGGECFDSILYVNVLEHIEDHAAELAVARDLLRPGGHLLVLVPALPALYSEFDRQLGHYRRYTRQGLVDLVHESGLSVVAARYFDLAGVIPWYISFTLLGNSVSGGMVGLYDRLVVPVTRAIERIAPPPVGKNVLLVARKD